jgi:hypothetical protein
MVNSWLVVAHISKKKEEEEFQKIFKKAQKQLTPGTDIHIIHIRGTKQGKVIHITQQDYTTKQFNKGEMSQTKWCNTMLNYVLTKTKPVCFSYFGHGGGLVVGPWYKPLMSLKKFNDIFIVKVKPVLIGFDSCYLGSIVSLYEISKNAKFALASPSWHPFTSISSMKLFGNIPSYTAKNKMEVFKEYAKGLSEEFSMVKNNPSYTCLVAFDLRNIEKAVKKIKTLTFTRETNLNLQDGDQYDLVSSVNEEAKEDLRKVVIYKNKCPGTINGISVSYQNVGNIWDTFYKKSKWGDYTIRKVKIHHVDDPKAKKY